MTRAERRRKRCWGLPVAIAIVAVAAVLGGVLGASGAKSPRRDVGATGDGFAVRHPADWQLTRSAPRIPGLPALGPGSVYLSADDNQAAFFAARRPGDLSQALPTDLAARLGSPGVEKSRARLRTGVQAYRWTAAPVNGTRVELFAVPVNGATLLVGCAARRGVRMEQCHRIVAGLETGASPVVELQPNVTFAAALRQAIGDASRAQRNGLERLRGAHSARGQANAAMAVWRTLRTASTDLAAAKPNAPALGWQRQAIDALASVGNGYVALANGFRARDRGAIAAARRTVRIGERKLAGALAALSAVGFGRPGRPAANEE
jgi:hypothetical protein